MHDDEPSHVQVTRQLGYCGSTAQWSTDGSNISRRVAIKRRHGLKYTAVTFFIRFGWLHESKAAPHVG